VEHTVLDLIEASATFEQAYDWICRAIGRSAVIVGQTREPAAKPSQFVPIRQGLPTQYPA